MNLPNRLTVFRICLVPIIIAVWLFPYGQFGINFDSIEIGPTSISFLNLIVLLLFLFASLTDMFDGKIARKYKLITTFGKFADPIADKLLVNSILIVMSYNHIIPVVPVIMMVSRDIVVDGCRMIAAENGVVVSAGFMGKLKTFLQMITICFCLLNNIPFELVGFPFSTLLIWFTSFISLSSGYSYFIKLRKYIYKSM